MTISVAIMNNTDGLAGHVGCARVMTCIQDELVARDFEIRFQIPSGTDWSANEELINQLANVDLIVVNGEGTLHHGRRKGLWLLSVATHSALVRPKKALVNALWQDNPRKWHIPLKKFDLIAARDSRSAAAMGQSSGHKVRWLPDLSTVAPVPAHETVRTGILVGDSVSASATALLARLAVDLRNLGEEAVFTPLETGPSEDLAQTNPIKRFSRLLARTRLRAATRGMHLSVPARDVSDYLTRLAQARLSVTGRFHTVCLSMATYTPFVAIRSNSRKIESMIEDAGLDTRRILHRGALSPRGISSQDWSYSDTEIERLEKYLYLAKSGVRELFDDLKKLALDKGTHVAQDGTID